MLQVRLFFFLIFSCASIAYASNPDVKKQVLFCAQDTEYYNGIEGGIFLGKQTVPEGKYLSQYHAHYHFDGYEVAGQSAIRADVIDQGDFKGLTLFDSAQYYLIAKFPYQEFIAEGQSFDKLTWCLDSVELIDEYGVSSKYDLDQTCCAHYDGKDATGEPRKALSAGGVMSIQFS